MATGFFPKMAALRRPNQIEFQDSDRCPALQAPLPSWAAGSPRPKARANPTAWRSDSNGVLLLTVLTTPDVLRSMRHHLTSLANVISAHSASAVPRRKGTLCDATYEHGTCVRKWRVG